jgi:hypothetical protein
MAIWRKKQNRRIEKKLALQESIFEDEFFKVLDELDKKGDKNGN